jgi:CRISPR-associated protein Cas1
MNQAIRESRSAQSLPDLLGIEGQMAKRYFSVFRGSFDDSWTFNKRTRRPPKDPVNALLSLGYTFLGYAVMAALESVGLDPYLGYFHAEAYGRPALALDLVEEFRTPIVDSLVLMLINRGTLQQDDFQESSDGVFLTTPGLRTFLSKFSQRLDSTVTPREIGRSVSYRKLLEVQARKLAHVLQGKTEEYQPFKAR